MRFWDVGDRATLVRAASILAEHPETRQLSPLKYITPHNDDPKLIAASRPRGQFLKVLANQKESKQLVGWVELVALVPQFDEPQLGQLVELRKIHHFYYFRSTYRVVLDDPDEKLIFVQKRYFADAHWFVFLSSMGLIETNECFVRVIS